MKQKLMSMAKVVAGLFVLGSFHTTFASTFTQDFASQPLESGWAIFGNTNLFEWDSTNQNLRVTWDSSQPNSYFYHSLGTIVNRNDDFEVGFDLRLEDAGPGFDPEKTGPFQLALGLLNLEVAVHTNFLRGTGFNATDLAEFNYFFAGYYPGYPFLIDATTVPVFISSGTKFAPLDYSSRENELPLNETVRVSMNYSASSQSMSLVISATNGAPLFTIPDVVLTNAADSQFSASDDFRVNAFSISSYSDTDAYGASLLAHGTVDNIVMTAPPPPVQNLSGAFSNNVWQAQFLSRSNWLYVLERTTNGLSGVGWVDVANNAPGNGTNLTLQDSNPPAVGALYRVRATRP